MGWVKTYQNRYRKHCIDVYDVWLVDMRQPLGHLVPLVLTLPTAWFSSLPHTHQQNYQSFLICCSIIHTPFILCACSIIHTPFILCACTIICAFLSIVLKPTSADVVYFNVSSFFRVNVSGSAKSGEVVFYANDTLSVDRENFINPVLTFGSYYSSLFRVR